jgi:hypothetical protein
MEPVETDMTGTCAAVSTLITISRYSYGTDLHATSRMNTHSVYIPCCIIYDHFYYFKPRTDELMALDCEIVLSWNSYGTTSFYRE